MKTLDRTIQAVQLLAVLAIALSSYQTLPTGDRTAARPSPTVQQKAPS